MTKKMLEAMTVMAADMVAEAAGASENWPPMNSLHEAYGVMAEEFDEVFFIVKQKQKYRDPDKLRQELIQLGAMALRTIFDIVDGDRIRK